jgi:exopolyphosphatase/guanosine-5'-triphosphate,3'-diphosphate pyrophosphatase
MTVVPRWEWRTFGDDLASAQARLGDPERVEESDERYILSTVSDASVKLRDGRFDVKELLEVDDDGLEQWRPVLKAEFPLAAEDAGTISAALGMPIAGAAATALNVHKRRAHHTVGGCRAEATELHTHAGMVRTLAVEGEEPAHVIEMVRRLGLGLADRPNMCVARGLKALIGFGPERYAVIDVGTNSVKLHIGERRADGRFRTVADRAAVTRLGEGLDTTGRLGATAVARTADAIADMAREAEDDRVREIAAVGTAGLRIAPNAADLVAAVRERRGVTVEVLPAEEEARLAYVATTAALGPRPGALVVFDTGGGSSQFTFGGAGQVEERFSVDVGAVRFTERYGLAHAVDQATVDTALAALADELGRLAGRPAPDAVVGMGGAVTNLAAMHHGLRAYDPEVVQGTALDVAEIDRQIAVLAGRDADARRSIPGLQPARAEVILAGACIVRTVLTTLGRDALTVSDRGLRHGLLAERFGTRPPLAPDEAARTLTQLC